MYSTHYDPATRVLSYTIAGFWDTRKVDDFATAFGALLTRHKGPGLRIMGNAAAFPVQTQAVATQFETFMMREAVPHAARFALVVKTTLNKLQVERAGAGPTMKVFLTEDEALAWLRS